jgi:hypothetical protein
MRIFLSTGKRRREHGSAVAVVLALVAIMLIYMGANLVALRSLDRELKLLEKKQLQRLRQAAPSRAASGKGSTLPAAQNEQHHD